MENLETNSMYSVNDRLAEIEQNGYTFETGQYISEGSALLSKNLMGFILYLLLFYAVSLVLHFIPFIGFLITILIQPALIVGFTLMAWRLYHNKGFDFGNFFDGFKFWSPLTLGNFVLIVFLLIICIPYLLLVVGVSALDMQMFKDTNPENAVESVKMALHFFFSLIPLILFVIIASLFLMFYQHFILFGGKSFWEAFTCSTKVVKKQFFSIFLFSLLLLLINLGGALCLLVGLLYTIPLSICAIYMAYQHIIGTPETIEIKNGISLIKFH